MRALAVPAGLPGCVSVAHVEFEVERELRFIYIKAPGLWILKTALLHMMLGLLRISFHVLGVDKNWTSLCFTTTQRIGNLRARLPLRVGVARTDGVPFWKRKVHVRQS